MCIIAAKPAGVPMPDQQTINLMWLHNPDGAGLMYPTAGGVQIRKGYMTKQSFESAITDLARTIDLTATPIVMHFRIRTHGETNAACTHPFPITDSVGALTRLRVKADVGLAHNGIINSVTPRKGLSDTMEYIASQLAPLKRMVPDFMSNKDAQLMIQNSIGYSKLAIMDKSGKIYTIGNFIKDKGVLYSNDSFRAYNSRISSWAAWDSCMADLTPWDAPVSEPTIEDVPLMWLDNGSYVLTNDGEIVDGEYLMLSEDNKVYYYDFEQDCAVNMPDATAWTPSGLPARFELEEAEIVPAMID